MISSRAAQSHLQQQRLPQHHEMSPHEPENNPTNGHVTDEGESLSDLNPQATAAPGAGAQGFAGSQYQNNEHINNSVDHDLQPHASQGQAVMKYSGDLTNGEAAPTDQEQEHGHHQRVSIAEMQERYPNPPMITLPALTSSHGETLPADLPISDLSSHHEVEESTASVPTNTAAAVVPSPTDPAPQLAAKSAESLRGNPYAFAASLSAPAESARQDPADLVQPQAEQVDTTIPHPSLSPQEGQQSPHPPADARAERGQYPTADQDDREEGDSDSDAMEITQNDASDESGSEDENEVDDEEVEDMRAKLQSGVARAMSQTGQQPQQQYISNGTASQNMAQGQRSVSHHAVQGQPGYSGYGVTPGMQHFPVQPHGLNSNAHGNGFVNNLRDHHDFSMPLTQETLAHMKASPHQQQQAPKILPYTNYDVHGYPVQSYGQGSASQGFGTPYSPFPFNMQSAQRSQNGYMPMQSAAPANISRYQQMMSKQRALGEEGNADDNSDDNNCGDDEPLRTRVARHPSALSDVDSVMGNYPTKQASAQYDEHDCGEASDDDDFQIIESKPVSKAKLGFRPAAKAATKPTAKDTTKSSKATKAAPTPKTSKKTTPASKDVKATPAQAAKATSKPSAKPPAESAASSSASDAPIDFKLPTFEAKIEHGEIKHDPAVATISIPGLVREDLLLSVDHGEQEALLLTELFLPTHKAFSFPDPEPATAVLNFHTIAVMVIEAFVQYEIGDEFGTGRGHWHDEHDNDTDIDYARLRDAKDADPDEIFFAVIDRWRAGLASNKQPAKLVRGSQEFCDVALQIIEYIKENGLVKQRQRAVRSDKGVNKGAKKGKDDAEGEKRGVKRGAQKINEVEARKKPKTAAATKGKAAAPKGKTATPKGKAAAPKRKSRAKGPQVTVVKASAKK